MWVSLGSLRSWGQKLGARVHLLTRGCSGFREVLTEEPPRGWGPRVKQLCIWKPLGCEVLEGRAGSYLSLYPSTCMSPSTRL